MNPLHPYARQGCRSKGKFLQGAGTALSCALGWCALAHGAEPATKPATPAAQPATKPAQAAEAQKVLVAPRVVAVAPNAPANFIAQQRQNVLSMKANMSQMAVAGKYQMKDLIRATLVDGLLRAESAIPTVQPGQNRVKIEGPVGADQAIWVINAQTFMNVNGASSFVNVNRYDFDQVGDDQFWLVSLTLNNGMFQLSGQGIGTVINYQQWNGQMMLNVFSQLNPGQQKHWQSANLLSFQAEHPQEMRQYLLPMLARLGLEDSLRPGAADEYAVLNDLQPEAGARQAIEELLPRLDADAYTTRDGASKDLARLGRPGVLAAVRRLAVDDSTLSEEQRGRLAAFVALHSRRSLSDLEEAGRDPYFLLDCLADDEAQVRAAAKAKLEKLAGHAIAFDVNLAHDKRLEAVDELRKVLPKEIGKEKDPGKGAEAPKTDAVQKVGPAGGVIIGPG